MGGGGGDCCVGGGCDGGVGGEGGDGGGSVGGGSRDGDGGDSDCGCGGVMLNEQMLHQVSNSLIFVRVSIRLNHSQPSLQLRVIYHFQIVEKIFLTHFVLEPFVVSCCRCLSSRHPVLKLLLPHLQYVCAGNLVIRNVLLSPGGVLDRLLSYGKFLRSIIE